MEDDDEIRRQRKVEKGKEPATKDADEERFVDDTKFVVDLLRSAFRILQNVGEAFDIKAPHEVDKDPNMKSLTFRIHELAEKLENLPVVNRAASHFDFDNGGSDGDDDFDGIHGGDDGSDTSHDGDDGGTPTATID
jgi:hypothetical protein